MNLCIAQYVREQMVEAPALLYTEPDIAEGLEVVRERSQIAMLQFGLLGVAFTSPDSRTPAHYASNQTPVVLRAFANAPENAVALPKIGGDYAAAVQLHTQTTRELANLLGRNASARLTMPSGLSGAALDWGPGGWRDRAFRLLYGGDPLYGANQTQLWPSSFSGTAWVSPSPPGPPPQNRPYPTNSYVDEDTRSPEVDELLAYARMADALYFRSGLDGGPAPAVPGEVDFEASAQQLYRSVEASLRHPTCRPTGGTAPATTCDALAWGADIYDPAGAQWSSNLLWQNRKITLDHARALAKRIGEAMPKSHRYAPFHGAPRQAPLLSEYEREGAMHFTGPLSYVDTASSATALPGAAVGRWYHLPQDTRMVPFSLADRAGFDNLSQVYMPLAIDMTNLGLTQGFTARYAGVVSGKTVDGQAQMRTLGAIPALAATRDALFTITNSMSGNAAVASFAAAAGRAVPLVDAAIGKQSVGVRPELEQTEVYEACAEWIDGAVPPGSYWCEQMTQRQGAPEWDLTLVTTAGDPYTSLVLVPSTLTTSLTASAAEDPTFVSYRGVTMASLVAGPNANWSYGNDLPGPNGTIRRTFRFGFGAGSGNRTWDFYLSIPAANGQPASYTRIFAGMWLGSLTMEEPINGNPALQMSVVKSLEGRWFASGGSLGALAQRLWATQAENWAQPAFDGFGFPTNMFQVTDPNLSTTDAVAYWLGEALTAATDAQRAVSTAIPEILQEQSNAITVQDAQKNARFIDSATEHGFCGTNNTSCDSDVVGTSVVLKAGNTGLLTYPDCVHVDPDAAALCTQYVDILTKIVPPVVYVPAAVAAQASSASAPSFSNFAGGSLQGLLTTDWGALNTLRRASVDGASTMMSRFAAAAVANAGLQASTETAKQACSDEAMQHAIDGGWSYGKLNGGTEHLDGAGTYVDVSNPDSASWSQGPLMAQIQACETAGIAKGPALAQLAATWTDAWAASATQLSAISSAFAAIQTANAAVSKAAADASSAIAEANLQAQFTAGSQQTSFGTYLRFYSLDLWQAEAALEKARLYAVYARRAIEAHYVVDLSKMAADEAFVVAPSTWADSIYASDLDAVTPVGLSISPNPNAINVNVITDYVTNLQNFVNGYFNATASTGVTRNVTLVPTEVDLFEIAGPDARTIVNDANGKRISVLAPQAMAWSFYCVGNGTTTDTWITNPAASESPAPDPSVIPSQLMTACSGGVAPTKARLTFSVDGWGRLNRDEAQDPSVYLFNARWNRLAVNLKGTGVKDCAIAPAGSNCAPHDNFVYYDLASLGPAWETDYDRAWHVLGTPIGRIGSAEALAADGVVWSIPSNSFGNADVEPFVRTDFIQRPLAGTYQLDVLVEPGVNLSAIDYVQILRDVSSWEIQGK